MDGAHAQDSIVGNEYSSRTVRVLGVFRQCVGVVVGFTTAVTLALAALTMTTADSGLGPELFHRQFLVVRSGSMEPSLRTGALAITQRISQEDAVSIPVGTVVAYRSLANPDVLITHRIIARTSNSNGDVQYVTKGDANVVEDSLLLSSSRVVGTLSFSVSHAGYFIAALERGQLLQLFVLAFLLVSIAVMLSKWAIQPTTTKEKT